MDASLVVGAERALRPVDWRSIILRIERQICFQASLIGALIMPLAAFATALCLATSIGISTVNQYARFGSELWARTKAIDNARSAYHLLIGALTAHLWPPLALPRVACVALVSNSLCSVDLHKLVNFTRWFWRRETAGGSAKARDQDASRARVTQLRARHCSWLCKHKQDLRCNWRCANRELQPR